MAIDDDSVTPGELPAINETPVWVEHLPAVIKGVKIRGGENGEGAANFQAKTLDARTRWLKEVIEGIVTGGIHLVGELRDEAELNAIPTEGLLIGTAYFVEFNMRVWNGTEWASSGSLRGKNGLNLLGTWSDNIDLPEVTENEIGDAYIWRHDIHVLVPDGETSKWEALGIRGPAGASAYEDWKTLPGNANKTLEQFYEEQKGEKGDDAYEAWLKIPVNEGKTREQWAEETRGLQGTPGKNLQVLGTVASESDLAAKPKVDQAAWVAQDTGHLWVYVLADALWKDLGKFRGDNGTNVILKGAVDTFADLPVGPVDQDAYAVRDTSTVYMYIVDAWVNLGRFQGEDGQTGTSLILKGAVATHADLPVGPADQDIYAVRDENAIYGFIVNAWVLLGQFKGEKGDDAVTYWLSLPANVGKEEADYWEAMKGANLKVLGTVADETALNAIQNPNDQDAYVVNTTGRLWVWSDLGGGWKDLGPFRGESGESAYQNWLSLGNVGSKDDFNTSLKGKDGESIKLTGVVATFADLPVAPEEQAVYSVQDTNRLYAFVEGAWLLMGSFKGADGKSLDIIKILTEEDPTAPAPTEENKGKAYVDLDKIVWVNVTGALWENAGQFKGQTGDDGKTGTGLKLIGTVAEVASLPAIGEGEEEAKEGDAYQTLDDKATWVVVDGQWNGPFDFTGPTGRDGEKGDPGATVAIKDTYVDMAALRAAHPTGVATDAYMLEDGHLVIWSVTLNDWKDVGQFQGPQGQEGPPGEGLPGKPGVKGDTGSRWLTLPEGVDEPSESFSGRVGDWAVSKNSLKVFYKSATQGWQFWGFIVAGDVNSPLLSFGKAIRWGDDWVPLPIDAVPNPVLDKIYGQALKQSGSTEMVWKEIVIPTSIADLSVKDGKQYCRMFATDAQVPVWAEIQFPEYNGIEDLAEPEADALYLRDPTNDTWVKYTKAPSDGKVYVQKDGNYISLDRMDYPILPISATSAVDPKVNQVIAINNTTNTAKTITLADGPKGAAARALLVPVIIKGQAGAVTFAATGATVLQWHKATVPTIQNSLTILSLFWTGEQWVGSVGPEVP